MLRACFSAPERAALWSIVLEGTSKGRRDWAKAKLALYPPCVPDNWDDITHGAPSTGGVLP